MSLDKFQKILSLNMDGNIIPHSWYSKITLNNGKPDLISIILLSEIVYWYRPVPFKDPETGAFLGYRKKFKSDILQRNYKSFEEQFGFSRRQLQLAFDRLEELGLIKRIYRNIKNNTTILANVMFIDLNVDALIKLTNETVITEDTLPNEIDMVNEKFDMVTQNDTKMGGVYHIDNKIKNGGLLHGCNDVITRMSLPSSHGCNDRHHMDVMTYTEIINTEITNTDNKNTYAPDKINLSGSDVLKTSSSIKNIFEKNNNIAEEVYTYYADRNRVSDNARDKERALRNISRLLKTYTPDQLKKAVDNYTIYRIEKNRLKREYIKDPANFFGYQKNNRFFEDFLEGKVLDRSNDPAEKQFEEFLNRIKEIAPEDVDKILKSKTFYLKPKNQEFILHYYKEKKKGGIND